MINHCTEIKLILISFKEFNRINVPLNTLNKYIQKFIIFPTIILLEIERIALITS